MNKVFISGTAVGNELEICDICTLDFSWLMKKPDTLIWADKIVITKKALDKYLSKNNTKMEKTIKLILEIAYANNILEIIELDDNMKKIAKPYYKKSIDDFKILMEKFPTRNIGKSEEQKVEEIKIGDDFYCLPYVASLYTEIAIAEKIGANCLFSNEDFEFLKNISKVDKTRIFNEIFSIYFPCQLIHNYAFVKESTCDECVKDKECKDNYLKEIENNMLEILKWRNYDEICVAKHEIDKIIKLKEKISDNFDANDIQKQFIEKQEKINRNIKKVFPKIKRWTNLATIISTPATIYAATNKNIQATIISASVGGISKAIDEGLKYYENKNNWVSFINKKV